MARVEADKPKDTEQKKSFRKKIITGRNIYAGLAVAGVVGSGFGFMDYLTAQSGDNDRALNFPAYTTSDGRYGLAKNLLKAEKALLPQKSVPPTPISAPSLKKDLNGDPIITQDIKPTPVPLWNKAGAIIKQVEKNFSTQPDILGSLRRINAEIEKQGASYDSTKTQDLFVSQRQEIESLIQQIAALKDTDQSKERYTLDRQSSKRKHRDLQKILLPSGVVLVLSGFSWIGSVEKKTKI